MFNKFGRLLSIIILFYSQNTLCSASMINQMASPYNSNEHLIQ